MIGGCQRPREQLDLCVSVAVGHRHRGLKRQRADHAFKLTGCGVEGDGAGHQRLCLTGIVGPVLEAGQRSERVRHGSGIIVWGGGDDGVDDLAGLGVGNPNLDRHLGPELLQAGVGSTRPGGQLDGPVEQGQGAGQVGADELIGLDGHVPRLLIGCIAAGARPAEVFVRSVHIEAGLLGAETQPSRPVNLDLTKASTPSISSLGSRVSRLNSVDVEVAPSAALAVDRFSSSFL